MNQDHPFEKNNNMPSASHHQGMQGSEAPLPWCYVGELGDWVDELEGTGTKETLVTSTLERVRGGEGENSDGWKVRETWGMGGMGNEGMRDFFLRTKVKLNQVSWWFYMMYPEKMPVKDWTLFVHFFFWNIMIQAWIWGTSMKDKMRILFFFWRVKTLHLGFFGEDPGRLVWFMLRLGCFFWRFPLSSKTSRGKSLWTRQPFW